MALIKLKNKLFQLFGIVVLSAVLVGCATPPSDPEERARYEEINDPLEPMNRVIFDFNLFIDDVFLGPVAKGYVAVVPEFIRNGISNLLDYLRLPMTFIAQILQGEFEYAGDTTGRFLLNTITLGFNDAATEAGIPNRSADLGQTFAKWGVPEGPYVVVPLLGSYNVRHATGDALEYFAVNPVNQWEQMDGHEKWGYIHTGLFILDFRAANIERFDQLKESSLDLYATMRSAYRQTRKRMENDSYSPDDVGKILPVETGGDSNQFQELNDPIAE
ncbi:VacJ family lipoprotein [Curvivirga sp.]|uniref:MlaA family lipoprotein n=1 Tax=Curvivirga sp. TaxID=2856848 RepID=UPI003B5BC026